MNSYTVNVCADMTRDTSPTWHYQTTNKREAIAAARKIRADGYLFAGYPFGPLNKISVTAQSGTDCWQVAWL